MRGTAIGVGLLSLLLLGSVGVEQHTRAQPDSVRAAILEAKGYPPDHSPRGALWRSAVLPGWGQFYNRQYLKMPFVYGGLAGGGYAIYLTNRNYHLYRNAAIYSRGQTLTNRGEEVPDVISNWESFRDDYEEVVQRVGGELEGQQLRKQRDKLRRWRDLSIVGTGLFYALTLLDAYVSAHLLSFNVGEDLALDVRPIGEGNSTRTAETGAIANLSPSNGGMGLRLQMRF